MTLFEILHYYPHDGGSYKQFYHPTKDEIDFKNDVQEILSTFVDNMERIKSVSVVDFDNLLEVVYDTLCTDHFGYCIPKKYTIDFKDSQIDRFGTDFDGTPSLEYVKEDFNERGCPLLKELLTPAQIDKILLHNCNINKEKIQSKATKELFKTDLNKLLINPKDPTVNSLFKYVCEKKSAENIKNSFEIFDIISEYIDVEYINNYTLDEINSWITNPALKISSHKQIISIIDDLKEILYYL